MANSNLHDIPRRVPFGVELWDRHDPVHFLGHRSAFKLRDRNTAFDATVANYHDQRFTLRNRILLIQDRAPKVGAATGVRSGSHRRPERPPKFPTLGFMNTQTVAVSPFSNGNRKVSSLDSL
jgi:hypothetical protein